MSATKTQKYQRDQILYVTFGEHTILNKKYAVLLISDANPLKIEKQIFMPDICPKLIFRVNTIGGVLQRVLWSNLYSCGIYPFGSKENFGIGNNPSDIYYGLNPADEECILSIVRKTLSALSVISPTKSEFGIQKVEQQPKKQLYDPNVPQTFIYRVKKTGEFTYKREDA